jgi:hypothetical protein
MCVLDHYYISKYMQTDTSTLKSNTNGIMGSAINEGQSIQFQDIFDWSSEFDINEGSRYPPFSDLSAAPDFQFKPIPPTIFRKASRKWLAQTSPNFFSQPKNTATLSKDEVLAGKTLQSFENYLSIVSLMFYGDPFSKVSRTTELLRPGKRARAKEIADPLSMLVSPLRAANEFGKAYVELWSPKQVAVFECALCKFGKNFRAIEKLMRNEKQLQEITRFYYLWKKTSHYKAWKDTVRQQFMEAALS